MLITLVTGGAFCVSLHLALIARIMRNDDTLTHSPLFVLGVTHFIAAVLLTPFLFVSQLSPTSVANLTWQFYGLVSLAVVLHIFAKYLHYSALHLLDISLVGAFAAISPALTIASGWLLLGEIPTKCGYLGIAVIVVSLLAMQQVFDKNFSHKLKNWSSFHSIRKNGPALALLATILPSFGVVITKMAVMVSTPLFYSCVGMWMAGTISLSLCVAQKGSEKLSYFFSNKMQKELFFSAVFLAASSILFSAALLYDITAHVSAMMRLTIVFQVVLGYYISGQKKDLGRRLFWAGGIMIGVFLISI